MPNGFEIIGQGLRQTAGDLGSFSDRQRQYEEMVQRRVMALQEQKRLEEEEKRQKAEEVRRESKFKEDQQKAQIEQQEKDRLANTWKEINAGKTVPGKAVNGTPPTRDDVVPYGREEIAGMLAGSGGIKGSEYMDATKPAANSTAAPIFKEGKDGYYHQYGPNGFEKTNLQYNQDAQNGGHNWVPVERINPDGSKSTVFVDPRNPGGQPVDPGIPKSLGGGEGMDVPGLRTVPGAKVTKQSVERIKKATETYLDLKKQIENYKTVYDAVGTEAVGANAEDMNSRAIGIQLSMKELENLGVLNGDDLRLMRELVPEAGGIIAKGRSMLNPALGDKFYTKMGTLLQRVDGKYDASLRSNGFEKIPDGENAAPSTPPIPEDPRAKKRAMWEAKNAPKEGDTKTNSNGRRVIYRGGRWVAA